jgi:hypothetical protein
VANVLMIGGGVLAAGGLPMIIWGGPKSSAVARSWEVTVAGGALSANRRAENLAGIGVQPAGNVQRQHRCAACVHRCYCFRGDAGDRARQTDTEDGVDDDIRALQGARVPGLDGAARCDKIVVRAARVTLQACRLVQSDRGDFEPLRPRESGQYVSIAPVVPRSADDSDALRGRPTAAQRSERGFARASHQRVGRDVQVVDCVPVQRAHLSSGVNGDGQSTHGRSLSKRILPRA